MPNVGIPVNIGTLLSCLAVLMVLVDLATSKTKVYIPDGPTHDNTVQLLAMAWGALFAVVIELLLPNAAHDAQTLSLAAAYGVVAAILAVGRYHLTKTPVLDGQGAADFSALVGAFQPAVGLPPALPPAATAAPGGATTPAPPAQQPPA